MAPLNWNGLYEGDGIRGDPVSIQSPDDSEKVKKLLKDLQKRGIYSNIRDMKVNPSLEDTKASGVNLDIWFAFLRPFP